MRMIQALLTIAVLSTTTLAFADKDGDGGHKGHGNGACKAYFETCKNDPSVTGAADKKAKHQAMKACVAAAATADTANGPACTAELAKKHSK